jgi:DNA mismatch repair protein MutH
MNDDEKTLLLAQAIIYAGITIAESIDKNRATTDENIRAAQGIAHLLSQNLDLGSGRPA